jgi:hypothetical protein
MNGEIVQDNSMQAEIMGSSKTSSDTIQQDAAASPLTARIPGLLSLAAVPAAMLVNPFFFGLAGGLGAFVLHWACAVANTARVAPRTATQ